MSHRCGKIFLAWPLLSNGFYIVASFFSLSLASNACGSYNIITANFYRTKTAKDVSSLQFHDSVTGMKMHKKYSQQGPMIQEQTEIIFCCTLLQETPLGGNKQAGSPWSLYTMLSTYRVICINTDNFSHDSVRRILLQRMAVFTFRYCGPQQYAPQTEAERNSSCLALSCLMMYLPDSQRNCRICSPSC